MESGETSNCNNGIKLLDAAMEGRADDAVELLRIDPSLIHIADPIGDTAVHVAARAGNGLTVSKMINYLVRDHLRIHKDDPKMVKHVLLKRNAHGNTPLHLALKNDHKDAVVRLVLADPGAIYITNDDQESPLDLANRAGIDLMNLSYALVHHCGNDDDVLPLFPAQWYTIQLSECEIAEMMSGQLCGTAMSDLEMRLVARSNDEDKGGDVKDEKRLSKLNKAVEAGREDEVKAMLKNDTKLLEYKNQMGWTALHAAAKNGSLGPLKIMIHVLEHNGELKRLLLEGDENDSTPLLHAIWCCHEEVACYLAEVAPRAICKIDRLGWSPLYLAVDMGFLDLVRCMTRADLPRPVRERVYDHAKKIKIAHFAVKKRNLAVLQAILEGLPEVINYLDSSGWSLLSYAASKGYFEEFSYILKSFPGFARKIDKDGSYPIHKAVAGGHVKVVKEFLLHCPQARQDTDHKGRNLIEIATSYKNKDVLSYLKGKEE